MVCTGLCFGFVLKIVLMTIVKKIHYKKIPKSRTCIYRKLFKIWCIILEYALIIICNIEIKEFKILVLLWDSSGNLLRTPLEWSDLVRCTSQEEGLNFFYRNAFSALNDFFSAIWRAEKTRKNTHTLKDNLRTCRHILPPEAQWEERVKNLVWQENGSS